MAEYQEIPVVIVGEGVSDNVRQLLEFNLTFKLFSLWPKSLDLLIGPWDSTCAVRKTSGHFDFAQGSYHQPENHGDLPTAWHRP